MNIALFYHSLLSDWNHGNAHFLRGVATELVARGHRVRVFEPQGGWSLENLLRDEGEQAIEAFRQSYPLIAACPVRYRLDAIDLDAALAGVDLVLCHEWSEPALAARLGAVRARRPDMRLLFHDTHHRALTQEHALASYDLRNFDGVLAFGAVIRDLYLARGWAARAWTWHEAADIRVFHPLADEPCAGDLVWVGNWGDDERAAALEEFLFAPVERLGLRAQLYGVRYPQRALERLERAHIRYGGWLANFHVPRVFARHRFTVHIPRRPYVEALHGIPTIRPFEAMACGIPLVTAPWYDSEGLFRPGRDYLVARSGAEMVRHLQALLYEPAMAADLALSAHQTILARHTCAHRVDELFAICRDLGLATDFHH